MFLGCLAFHLSHKLNEQSREMLPQKNTIGKKEGKIHCDLSLEAHPILVTGNYAINCRSK